MVGLDIGTGFLASARQDGNGQIQTKSIRDCFIDIDNEVGTRTMLSMSKINYIESDDKLYIVGDPALTMANIFKREVRRPLASGVISPGELEAEKIVLILIENVIGKAKVPGEICFYSVPAAPIDKSLDIIYHSSMFSKLIGSLGYKPIAMNEGQAVVYSNCAAEQFSGLGVSLGAGQINVALLYQTMVGMAFSIIGSGDSLDESVARAVGTTKGRAQAIKEAGINLLDPSDGDPKTFREREAYIIYYKSLILKVLDAIRAEFQKHKGGISLPNSIPVILSGGSSLPKGFKELFEAGFNTIKSKFDIPVSEIRMATDPLAAVCQGLLIAALNYSEGCSR